MTTWINILDSVTPDNYRAALQDFTYKNCANPQRIGVWNSLAGKTEFRVLPCGTCWACCRAKSAEMVTRLHLHKEYWPNCYFVTLTYAPITNVYSSLGKALFHEFEETMPVWDAENKLHSAGYQPCLLSRAHLRNYLKRLRKLIGTFSYYAVGEYGHSYGRPHYHLCVFTKDPLHDLTPFTKAWGKVYYEVPDSDCVCGWRGQKGVKVFDVPFGDVKVVDLSRPEYQLKKHNTLQDVFNYVAKYVNKFDIATSKSKNKVDLETGEISSSKEDEEKNVKKFSHNCLRISKVFCNFAPEIIQNRFYYEYKQIPTFKLYEPSAIPPHAEVVHPFSRSAFMQRFAPFSVQSCVHAIGKDFINEHMQGLADGLEELPNFDGRVKVRFPTYYKRKIGEFRHSLRVCKLSSNGSSLSLGSLPHVACNLLSAASRLGCDFSQSFRDLLPAALSASFLSGIVPRGTIFYDLKLKQYFKFDHKDCRFYLAYYSLKHGLKVTKDYINDINFFQSRLVGLSAFIADSYATNVQTSKAQDARAKVADYLARNGVNFEMAFSQAYEATLEHVEDTQKQYQQRKIVTKQFCK